MREAVSQLRERRGLIAVRDPDVHKAKRQRTAETVPLGDADLPLDVLSR